MFPLSVPIPRGHLHLFVRFPFFPGPPFRARATSTSGVHPPQRSLPAFHRHPGPQPLHVPPPDDAIGNILFLSQRSPSLWSTSLLLLPCILYLTLRPPPSRALPSCRYFGDRSFLCLPPSWLLRPTAIPTATITNSARISGHQPIFGGITPLSSNIEGPRRPHTNFFLDGYVPLLFCSLRPLAFRPLPTSTRDPSTPIPLRMHFLS